MIDSPKIELKSSVSVQGRQNVNDLVQILSNTRKTGELRITISEGGAVAAQFDEKISIDKALVVA